MKKTSKKRSELWKNGKTVKRWFLWKNGKTVDPLCCKNGSKNGRARQNAADEDVSSSSTADIAVIGDVAEL